MDGLDAEFFSTFNVALIIIEEQRFLWTEISLKQHLLKNFRIRLTFFHAVRIIGAMKKIIQG